MCRLAVSGLAQYEIDDVELLRSGPSYTLDTVRQLAARDSTNGPVHWLIGSDTLPQLLTWHEPEKLLAEVVFVVMARPGSPIDWGSLPPTLKALRANVVQMPQIDLSATQIRQRVAQRRPIEFFTPPAVCRYIQSHQLYRSA
jgi:nicotinate-nucleotide adenylyltransferase